MFSSSSLLRSNRDSITEWWIFTTHGDSLPSWYSLALDSKEIAVNSSKGRNRFAIRGQFIVVIKNFSRKKNEKRNFSRLHDRSEYTLKSHVLCTQGLAVNWLIVGTLVCDIFRPRLFLWLRPPSPTRAYGDPPVARVANRVVETKIVGGAPIISAPLKTLIG